MSAASRAALLALAALLLPATALGAKKGKARPQKADSRARGVVTLAGQRLMSATEHGPDQPRADEPTTAVFALGTQLGGVASVGLRFPPWVKGGAGGFYLGAMYGIDGGGASAAVRQPDDVGTVDLVTYQTTVSTVAGQLGGMAGKGLFRISLGGSWGRHDTARSLPGAAQVEARVKGVYFDLSAARRFNLPGPLDLLLGPQLSIVGLHSVDQTAVAPYRDDPTRSAQVRYGLWGGVLTTF